MCILGVEKYEMYSNGVLKWFYKFIALIVSINITIIGFKKWNNFLPHKSCIHTTKNFTLFYNIHVCD